MGVVEMVLMKGQFSVQEKRIIEEVSEDKLMSHVHEISKYVRMSGSEDEAKSL
jgi:hypothetical protein